METTILTNTMPGVPDWSDIAMRTAIETHMAERMWTTKDLAAAMETGLGATERWLSGDSSATVFRARLKRYLEKLGYPGDEAAVANARRLRQVAQNGNGHREAGPIAVTVEELTVAVESEPATELEPESGHARIDATIAAINAEIAATDADPGSESVDDPPTEDWGWYAHRHMPAVRCRVCGCTDDDCSGCVERTGEPCHWVESDLCSACAATAGAPQVTGTFIDVPQAADPRPAWSLPEGFTILPPATSARVLSKPGITVHKQFDKAHLSRSLYRDELQCPTHVLIAVNGSELLIARATGDEVGAMRVSKDGDVSASVAHYVRTIGKPAGFYPATEDPNDGSWRVQL